MNTLISLPQDIYSALFEKMRVISPISYLILTYVSRSLYRSVTIYAIQHNLPRILTCYNIALEGHLNILKWARSLNYLWDLRTCHAAAYKGNLDILKWARLNGCNWNESICTAAAKNGHKDIVEWAISHDCPVDQCAYIHAAEHGYIEILKIMPVNQYSVLCYELAALNGHLDVIKFLSSKNVDYSWKTYKNAVRGGHIEIIKWLLETDITLDESLFVYMNINHRYEICALAVKNDNPEILMMLRGRAFEWTDETAEIAKTKWPNYFVS